MKRIVIRVAVNAVALWVAAALISGISLEKGFWKVVLVAAIFGLVNAFLRPIAKLFSLPLIILTLGLFILVINAVMLLITDWLTASLEVENFGSALLGALVISLVSWGLSVFVPDKTLWTD